MAGQGSARVTLKEIDLSQVSDPEVVPQGVPAAVVGPAKRGPAFVPKTFATIQQFEETFGSLSEVSNKSNSNLSGPLALNEWMRNARAGTFLRVLGVGDGQKATSGRVTNAGFVVGNKSAYDANDLVINPFSNHEDHATARTAALSAARTHFLGCFMADTEGSRYLTDAGVQPEDTAATLVDAITAVNIVDGNKLTLFLPKEVINQNATTKVNSDVTINIEFVANTTGTAHASIAKDTALVGVDNGGSEPANFIERLLKSSKAAGEKSDGLANDGNGSFRFNDLSINLSEHFTVANGTGVNQRTITLASTRKEGNEVVLTQTVGGTTILGVASKTLSGSVKAVPVIRGILMSPLGIIPTIKTASGDSDYTSTASDTLIRKNLTSGNALRNFGDTAATDYIGYQVGEVGTADQDFVLYLNGLKLDESLNEPAQLACSFDPESVNYFGKVLNTDPEKINERGHYLYASWDIDKAVAVPSFASMLDGTATAITTLDRSAFCMHSKDARATEASNSPDFESFDARFRTASSPWFISQDSLNAKLFKLYALDDGAVGCDRFRILISNLRSGGTDYGSFDLALEAFDSDPVSGESLITWKNLNLDPDSRNYITRVIGDKNLSYNFDKALSKQRLEETGDFEVKNKYVRVEVHEDVKAGLASLVTALPCGFEGLPYLDTVHTTSIFSEKGDDGSGNNKLLAVSHLASPQVLPVPFVKSVARKSGSSLEADSSLPWGIKFAKKKNTDDSFKELSEIRFNHSVASWTKFFPDMGTDPAMVTDSSSTNTFQRGKFSLEKISVKVANSVIDWSSALYNRSGTADSAHTRLLNITTDATGQNVRYLKFRTVMQGGFDGLDIFNKEKAALSTVAAFREATDENANSTFTGATIESFKRAVDVLTDKSNSEFQLLAIPGIREPLITDYAVNACETRFDAMMIMDIEEMHLSNAMITEVTGKAHVSNTITKFKDRNLDTSFGAAYFPDVIIRRPSNGSPLQVPPSVSMLGVMSQNDSIADPWFAPAGLNRGRLRALNSKVQMNRDLLDNLYDADINPIYEPAGRAGQVYAFGQKTLLQDQSALDRINVRRLLINVRRKVKNIAQTLLFEPNRASTLAKFSSLVEPIMSEVQARQGVDRYKVQIDTSTTTQNDVENNTIRGKIYLQPTKSVEFISLDFVVTNSID
jgi:hypothetical protein